MTDFFTHCCKSALLRAALALAVLISGLQARAQTPTEVSQFRLERAADGIALSALLQFDVPAAVEDALVKGIPMVFVQSAEITRERWYWYDKRVLAAERHLRLAYQPLTRRWRLNVNAGPGGGAGVGMALNQSFDTLSQALVGIKRVSLWRVAEVSELEPGVKYKVEFRFRLDLGQLPRPFQIGALGDSDWDIGAALSIPFSLESVK